MLVELRGKLDEVARHCCTGKSGIFGVGEHAMQRVAELVEHGGDIAEAEQSGLARRRLAEVADVVDHRQRAQQLGLVNKVAHPGAAVFVVALEVVAVKKSQGLAVGVEHLEHAHIRVVHRNVVALLEGDAVELVGGVKHAILQHIVQLEIGLDLRFVQVVLGFADLLGVEVPVPWLQLEAAASARR